MTAHKSLIPDIRPWGRFLMHSGYGFVWLEGEDANE